MCCCSLSSRAADCISAPPCPAWKRECRPGSIVYRLDVVLLAIRCTCQPPRSGGRSCERPSVRGGRFSLIGAPFLLGKKIRHSNVALADAMGEGFSRSERGFMSYCGPKVTQLNPGTPNLGKLWLVIVPDPTGTPRTRRPHPETH